MFFWALSLVMRNMPFCAIFYFSTPVQGGENNFFVNWKHLSRKVDYILKYQIQSLLDVLVVTWPTRI